MGVPTEPMGVPTEAALTARRSDQPSPPIGNLATTRANLGWRTTLAMRRL